MERLTNANHKEFGFCAYAGPKNPYSAPIIIGELSAPPNADYSPNAILVDVFERLASYEDIGLEPEEIGALIPPPNNPLTLNQLRKMDGEPVWVKVSENWRKSGVKGGWRLVRLHKSDDRIRIYTYDTHFGPTFLAEQDYGQSWIAYRRKLEGDKDNVVQIS